MEKGLEQALNRQPQSQRKPYRRKSEQEAHLIALTCSTPPSGCKRKDIAVTRRKISGIGGS